MSLSAGVLTFVTLQRLAELVLARRNTRRLLAKGAIEVAPEHYRLIVAVHGAWLAGLWIFAWNASPEILWLVVFALLQAGRVWILLTLGERWTTRILAVPGAPLVRRGPYRWIAHPNYVVVVGEIAVLPVAFGLVWFALLFSVLNAAVLAVRIRAENVSLDRVRNVGGESPA